MGIQLESGAELAGIPILKIRDLLRNINDCMFTKAWFYEKGYCEHQADHLLEALLKENYIQPHADATVVFEGRSFYKITEKGRAMMRATGAKPVHRETATQAIDGFMGRVGEVNENPRFLVKVTEVVIFGSYLTAKDRLGDVDIACNYASKISHLDTQEFAQKAQEHFIASGRQSRGLSNLFWPWAEVELFLKNKKRTISLHRLDEVEQMIGDSPVFRFEVLLGDREEILKRSRRDPKN